MSPRRAPSVLRPLALLLAVLATGCDEFPTGGLGYFVVNSTADEVDAMPGDARCATARGACTLRAAVMESNAMPGANTVRLPAGTYVLGIAGSGGAEQGDLDVTGDLRIEGGGTTTAIVDANSRVTLDRAFEHVRGRFQVFDVMVKGGDAQNGGAIQQLAGVLLLRRVLFLGNSAFSSGGALALHGWAEIEDCTFDSNLVDSRGGGISVGPTGVVGVSRSTFVGNYATLGGALYNGGTTTLWNVTVSRNEGTRGGGGINNNGGELELVNVTVAYNKTSAEDTRAGGLSVAGGTVRMSNSILAHNTNSVFGGSEDCGGTVTSRGYNLVMDPAGCTLTGDTTGNLTGQDPLLGELLITGGATRTHALSSRSPARNAGNPGAVSTSDDSRCRPTDQRGLARPVDGRCDMGATEQ